MRAPSRDAVSISSSSLLCSCKKDDDRQYSLVLIIAIIYFLAISISSIPLILLINQRIAGAPDDPSSQSAFVAATASFIQSFVSFLFGRYTAGLSDYLGRKPILFIGATLSLIGRIIFLQSTSSGGFYVGSIIGAPFSCFYFVILACISDFYPLYHKRSKRVGIFTGLVGGFAFIIGVPLGSALATHSSPTVPIRLSVLLFFLTMICIVFFPFSDTKAMESLPEQDRILLPLIGEHRSLPSNWRHFLLTYFPIYFDTKELISSSLASTQEAIPSFPLIWWVNFLMHCLSSLLYLIFIQYCLAIFHWSPALASGSVLFIGISLGILSPSLLHSYHPIALAFYLMISFIIGVFFLAIAGTGLSDSSSLGFGLVGVICIGLGTTWVPSLHAIILPQYPLEVQGKINGLLSQQNDASVLPAYVMSLGFTLSLHKHRGEDEAFWPGSAFGAVSDLMRSLSALRLTFPSH
jgi:MFS family permease